MEDRSATELRVIQRLARDQWVRLHGTPRVTMLLGDARTRALWLEWLALTGATGLTLTDEDGPLDVAVHRAIHHALEQPTTPVAIITSRSAYATWRKGRTDRDAALIDEGVLDVGALEVHGPPSSGMPFAHLDARSAAEIALFEALEATPATRGRFQLNESLSVQFGSRAAEIDLLSRADRIAVEIDGYHHFTDLDSYRRDRRKDLLLQTQDYIVIRVLAEDVMKDPREAVTSIVQVIVYRQSGAPR